MIGERATSTLILVSFTITVVLILVGIVLYAPRKRGTRRHVPPWVRYAIIFPLVYLVIVAPVFVSMRFLVAVATGGGPYWAVYVFLNAPASAAIAMLAYWNVGVVIDLPLLSEYPICMLSFSLYFALGAVVGVVFGQGRRTQSSSAAIEGRIGRPRPHLVVGTVLFLLGIGLLFSIPAFSWDIGRAIRFHRTHVGPAIEALEAELGVESLDEPERSAITTLSSHIVGERYRRVEWIVGCAFVAPALALMLAGGNVILLGRIRTLEKQI